MDSLGSSGLLYLAAAVSDFFIPPVWPADALQTRVHCITDFGGTIGENVRTQNPVYRCWKRSATTIRITAGGGIR
jgi:hypothetical protein